MERFHMVKRNFTRSKFTSCATIFLTVFDSIFLCTPPNGTEYIVRTSIALQTQSLPYHNPSHLTHGENVYCTFPSTVTAVNVNPKERRTETTVLMIFSSCDVSRDVFICNSRNVITLQLP